MPWFRVDDSFWGHPKAIAAGPALALWLRAGCWSAQQLTDGFIPHGLLPMLSSNTKAAAQLVKAGLWVVVDGGWRFHDWSDYQPSKTEVEAERAAARDRMRKVRAARKGTAPDTDVPPNSAPNGPPNSVENVDENVRRSSPNPGPARPGPSTNPLLTLAGRLGEVDAHDLAASLPTDLVTQWRIIAGAGVDLDAEARAYLAHHGDQPARNPRAAWLGWLRRARALPLADPPRDPCGRSDCLGGWLVVQGAEDAPTPCPACKPHLRPVPNQPREAAS